METDWRLKIGKISPSVYVHSREYHRMLPEGMDIAVVTTGIEEITEGDLSAAREEAVTAIRRLDNRNVDCIIAGGAPIYALDDDGETMLSRVREETDAPIASSLQSNVDALRAVDAESVLAVTPYPPARNRDREAFLADSGFDVVDIGGLESTGEVASFVDTPPTEFAGLARRMARDTDEPFDSLYLPCAAMKVADYIEPLEEDLGVPVVTSAQAQVWKAFELGGVNPPVEGYGQLFDVGLA